MWARTDCCTDALEGAFITLSNTPFTSDDLSVLSQPGVSAYIVNDVDDASFTVSVDRVAQYVRIQHPTQDVLHLAEVDIVAGVGNEAGSPPVEGLVAVVVF